MFTAEVREFLQRRLVARMSVIDAEGFPHTVPVSFIMDGDDVVITTLRRTAKVRYIQANPKGAVVIGGDWSDGAGYLLKGEFSVEEDPEYAWLRRTSLHYHDGDPVTAEQNMQAFLEKEGKDMVILRLRVQRVIKVYGE